MGEFIRAATYNIHRMTGRDGRRDPDRIADVIRALDADLVGLQEVDWRDEPQSGKAQYEPADRLKGYQAVAGPNLQDYRGHYGNLLLVRGKICNVRRVKLGEAGREPRGAVIAEVIVRGRMLRCVTTHFGLRLGERRRQSAKLAQAIANGNEDKPLVLLGDFNEWLPRSPGLRALLCQGTSQVGQAKSFPSCFPIFGLDRILTRKLGPVMEVRAFDTPLARVASDHLPVVATFRLADLA
ncbi:endonuclease/exonuclease/phosphatase family protein [Marivita sp. XM-24bin2]|jgi:endonuclease/exonuclease/phosphatase family metal-dependent hydrolase|uniref:endonuclease/exonuclease/phosphatase family protein n=1 Tax=unclassified Marivita TaxID=2632480 RepID=UPI000D7971D2|nr:endonuclease/exonuclease/phosphatase family protein [Marivita sp. XM-24bin2]MCR9110263.1 endonuclease/exonuclease/phosphatase family protein [Paracoccaceae bacterium]PWL33550.1 MAG: hypothetical protein DCO97_19105 [Marivita sp. XM-24bin2]